MTFSLCVAIKVLLAEGSLSGRSNYVLNGRLLLLQFARICREEAKFNCSLLQKFTSPTVTLKKEGTVPQRVKFLLYYDKLYARN